MLGIFLSPPPLFKIAFTVLYLATDRAKIYQMCENTSLIDCFLSRRESFMESS